MAQPHAQCCTSIGPVLNSFGKPYLVAKMQERCRLHDEPDSVHDDVDLHNTMSHSNKFRISQYFYCIHGKQQRQDGFWGVKSLNWNLVDSSDSILEHIHSTQSAGLFFSDSMILQMTDFVKSYLRLYYPSFHHRFHIQVLYFPAGSKIDSSSAASQLENHK